MASPPPSARPGRSLSRLLTVPALALALVANGRARLGERLHALSPVAGRRTEVELVDPVFVDPAGERVRG